MIIPLVSRVANIPAFQLYLKYLCEVVGGSKKKVQGPFVIHVGPLIGLLCFGNCGFFFLLVNYMSPCGWVLCSTIYLLHSRNKHSLVGRLSWQILHHFFFFFSSYVFARLVHLSWPQKRKKRVPPCAPRPLLCVILMYVA
jgi:hypothetical protein